MARLGRRYFNALKAHIITAKNVDTPLNKHWDLSVSDYVDDPVEEGYHWDNDLYKMVPD